MDRRTALAATTRAQTGNFPTKPIRIILPFNAGSGTDSTARAYGEIMSRMLGQPVIVENRPGASGLIAIQAVKALPADGYTIFSGTTSPMCVTSRNGVAPSVRVTISGGPPRWSFFSGPAHTADTGIMCARFSVETMGCRTFA